jgi:hypothetical protein
MARIGSGRDSLFRNFTKDMFINTCILAGCDYLPSLNGVGVAKASKLVRKYRTTARILRGLRFDGALRIPPTYEASFHRARLTFLYHKVFRYGQPDACLEPLNPVDEQSLDVLDEHERDLAFAGPSIEPVIALRIARGEVDPISKQPFDAPPSDQPPVAVISDFVLASAPTLKPPPTWGTVDATAGPFEAQANGSDRKDERGDVNNDRTSSRHFAEKTGPISATGATKSSSPAASKSFSNEESTIFKRRRNQMSKSCLSLFSFFAKAPDKQQHVSERPLATTTAALARTLGDALEPVEVCATGGIVALTDFTNGGSIFQAQQAKSFQGASGVGQGSFPKPALEKENVPAAVKRRKLSLPNKFVAARKNAFQAFSFKQGSVALGSSPLRRSSSI